MLIFSVKVAKPVPLKAPFVDAILVDFAVELVEPEVVVPEEVLPGEVLVGEDVVLLVPHAQRYRNSNHHDYNQKRSKKGPELPPPLQC